MKTIDKLLSVPVIIKNYIIKQYIGKVSNEEEKFTIIYKSGFWAGYKFKNKSGSGSSLSATTNIRNELSVFLREYDIKSIFDVPCGDFNWMSELELEYVDYIGGDIVKELVSVNQNKYANNNKFKFLHFDLLRDELPHVDIIFIRDLFIHLSNEQVSLIMSKVLSSKIRYIITTTYPELKENKSVSNGDRWRKINLEIMPFNLPKPMLYLDDSWSEDKVHSEKKMGVWKILDLIKTIEINNNKYFTNKASNG